MIINKIKRKINIRCSNKNRYYATPDLLKSKRKKTVSYFPYVVNFLYFNLGHNFHFFKSLLSSLLTDELRQAHLLQSSIHFCSIRCLSAFSRFNSSVASLSRLPIKIAMSSPYFSNFTLELFLLIIPKFTTMPLDEFLPS